MGKSSEEPHKHLMQFVESSENFQYRHVPDDFVKLSLFPFSPIGEAREWLTNLPAGSITYWEVLSNKFIDRVFSAKKTKELRGRIANFTQRDSESLTHAWERDLLNASAQRQILNKTYDEMEALLELMSEGAYEYQKTSWGLPQKAVGVLQVDDVTTIRADISTLTNVMLRAFPQAHQVQPVQQIQQAACQNCGVEDRGNYYGNDYNPPFGKQNFHKPNNYQQPKAQPANNLEEMMKHLIAQTQGMQQQNQKIQSEMQKSIHEFERQMGQL
ncbi:uncharacterized protein LOC132612989 [Lycium barbarum]|uniref:uncharacterized protein LOC132612989 n=1 Tax=Lycium barbarum TaxID=112863 RepID=UPI00293E0944|nr:uncharacterized protein LOC132612989 [Lycium barbarum]